MPTKSTNKTERFAPCPTRAIRDASLTPTDFRVLLAIAAHDQFGRNGVGCYASHNRLAEIIGIHKTTLSNSISRLIERGYIESRKRSNDRRFRVYRVIYSPDDEEAFRREKTGPKHCPGAHSMATPVAIDGRSAQLSHENHSNTHTPIYFPKGEKYKEIDPPEGDLGNGAEHEADEEVLDKAYLIKKDAELGKTDLAVGTQRLVANLASGKDARRSTLMSESDQVIDDASKRAEGYQAGKTFELDGRDVKPSSALLSSALSRKARGL